MKNQIWACKTSIGTHHGTRKPQIGTQVYKKAKFSVREHRNTQPKKSSQFIPPVGVPQALSEVNILDGCCAAILKDPKSKNDIRATPILEAAEHQFARGCAAVLCRARRTGQ